MSLKDALARKSLRILNSKEKKVIYKLVKDQWGVDFKPEQAILQSRKNKLYFVEPTFADVDIAQLKIDSVGNYFGLYDGNELRLSIEGSQMIGPDAKKNVVEMDHEQMRSWLKGNDLDFEGKETGFVILKYKKDFLGTGKRKEKKILNFVPKTRRILSAD